VAEVVKKSFGWDSAGQFLGASLMYCTEVVSEVLVAIFFLTEWHSSCGAC
jgi:hypothetical protein